MRKFKFNVDWIKFRGKRYTKGQVIEVDFDKLGPHDKRVLLAYATEEKYYSQTKAPPKSKKSKKSGSMLHPRSAVVESGPIELKQDLGDIDPVKDKDSGSQATETNQEEG